MYFPCNKLKAVLILCAFASLISVIVHAAPSASNIPPVVIDYFFEAGCADCLKVKQQILPALNERYEGFFRINNYDVGIKTNVIRLAVYQEKLNVASNKPVMMVVDYRWVLNGFDSIKSGLFKQLDESVAARLEQGWIAPEAITVKERDMGVIQRRMERFTASVVITAGLLDGLNPCAIASLVFFMSLLTVARVRGRGLMLMGVSFCLASFLTYTVIGFGLLRALHLFSGFPMMRRFVDAGMIIVLGVFALMSFRDAYRYRKTGNPDDVTLQLPEAIKTKIHSIMRRGIECRSQNSEARTGEEFRQDLRDEQNGEIMMGRIAVGGVIIGVLVTALESVCTGQMYVPTLVVMAKSGMSKAWGYLLLYNLMFIVPLSVVFAVTYFGLRTQALLDFSRRNVIVTKSAIGVFFLIMALLLVIL